MGLKVGVRMFSASRDQTNLLVRRHASAITQSETDPIPDLLTKTTVAAPLREPLYIRENLQMM